MRRQLTMCDREEISRFLLAELSFAEIGVRVGRCPSVVSREVRRHGGRVAYRCSEAEAAARVGRARPKALAVDRCARRRREVQRLLRGGWSPGAVAGRLRREHPHDKALHVSHEAIYSWVYAQPVSGLARELIALRTKRTARRSGPRPAPRPRIKQPRYIDERPAEAADRAVPGHWEGDLVIGKNGKTAVATLVERTSRFLVLCPLSGRDSLTVTQAVIAAVGPLPTTIRRSLTWDCGSELALHADVTATALPVYFAHPHSPWERGSNENLNRILREFFPKGTDITSDPRYLAAVAAEINDRPRKIHGWKKPSELFAELLQNASTA